MIVALRLSNFCQRVLQAFQAVNGHANGQVIAIYCSKIQFGVSGESQNSSEIASMRIICLYFILKYERFQNEIQGAVCGLSRERKLMNLFEVMGARRFRLMPGIRLLNAWNAFHLANCAGYFLVLIVFGCPAGGSSRYLISPGITCG